MNATEGTGATTARYVGMLDLRLVRGDARRIMLDILDAFGLHPRDVGIWGETPRRTAMHTAYRAKTRRRTR